ncbi:MAG: DMT family transporter [Chloroflexota bacterium]
MDRGGPDRPGRLLSAGVDRPDPRGVALTLLAAVTFGSLGVIARLAADAGLGTLGFVTWRSVAGFATLALVLVVGLPLGRVALPRPGSVTARQRRLIVITGIVNMLTNVFIFAAYGTTAVAIVVIVLYSYPALVAIGANRLWGEPIDRTRGGALILASAGLILVVLGPVLGGSGIQVAPLGLVLAAGGAVLQAIYTLMAARGFPAIPSFLGATLILGVVVVGNVVVTLLVGAGAQLQAPLDTPGLWSWVLLAGVIGAAVPGVALMMGIRSVGPSRAAILMMLEPVTAVVAAAIFLGESPSAIQVVGGLMVVVAGVILQLPQRRPDVRPRGSVAAG